MKHAELIFGATFACLAAAGGVRSTCQTTSGPPYPVFLTNSGITNATIDFNPDLTLPVEQVVGLHADTTPLAYTMVAYVNARGAYKRGDDANRLGTAIKTDADGLHLLHSPTWSQMISTVDENGNGKQFGVGYYFEMQLRADYDTVAGGDGAYYTHWFMSVPAFQSRDPGVTDLTTCKVNMAEMDVVEAYRGTQYGNEGQVYASTLVPNTENCGPNQGWPNNTFGLNQPHSDPSVYGVSASPLGASLWGRTITWGLLWTPTTITFVRDNVAIWSGAPAAAWTNPNPSGGQKMLWMSMITDNPASQLPTSSNYNNWLNIKFMRAWKVP